jgi:protein-S-isoprenylcysteine O-methyltransferase Ste14
VASERAEREGDVPGVIMLPPVIYLLFLIVGVVANVILSWPLLGHEWLLFRLVACGILVAGGLGLAIAARQRFTAAGTNVNPRQPALAFVAEGPYRLTRNPMYLGMNAVYLGLSLAFDSVWNLVLFVPLILVLEFGVIRREERYLAHKFGAPYLQYRARVRRWL